MNCPAMKGEAAEIRGVHGPFPALEQAIDWLPRMMTGWKVIFIR